MRFELCSSFQWDFMMICTAIAVLCFLDTPLEVLLSHYFQLLTPYTKMKCAEEPPRPTIHKVDLIFSVSFINIRGLCSNYPEVELHQEVRSHQRWLHVLLVGKQMNEFFFCMNPNSCLSKLPHGISEKLYAMLISTYTSTFVSNEAVKFSFYKALQYLLQSISRTVKIILLEDFNARVGSD